jgi:tricorn protease
LRAQSSKPLLLRDPSISKTHIAFAYAGDIWVANRDGGEVRRITGGGHASGPVLSPDGSRIAFVERRDGQRSIWVVSAADGEARRLTNNPADTFVAGWTPDGTRVLFSSGRAAFARGVEQIFSVSVEGGPAAPLPLVRASEASLSQDGSRIAYVPGIPHQDAWKKYRGGQTRTIWIASIADSNIEARIPREGSDDSHPMWVGDTVYFISDRNGPATLFAYDIKSKQVKQVVKNEGLDIKSASACSDAIAYEQFGSLHVLDLKSGSDKALDIRPVAELPETRAHFQKIEPRQLASPDISPTGARIAFAVRGEIVTVPAEKGDIRNLTGTTEVVERDPAWSPDGQSIAYLSDESGEYQLHIRDQSGLGEVRKISLGTPTFYYSPRWSPDSKKISYSDKRLNFWYIDLEKKTPVKIDTDMYTDPIHTPLQMVWSPDSRWIAYTKQLKSHLHAVFVYSIEEDKSYQLTDGMSDTLFVTFDKSGKYLYFTASTDTALAGSWLDISSLQRSVTRGVYMIVLSKSDPSPLAAESDEEKSAGKTDDRGASPQVAIDFENITDRILPLPVPARDYYAIAAGKPGVVYLVEGPAVNAFPLNTKATPRTVNKFDLRTRKAERIVNGVTLFQVSRDAEKMLYARGTDWFVAPADKPVDPSQAASGQLKLDSLELYVEPRAEWKHIYDQAWRDERDFFYDPGLHGLTLEAIKKKYEPYLAGIGTRDDLDYLFNEMLGNMAVGHMYAAGPDSDIFGAKRAKVGLLGADYAVENGRYRFTRIYSGDPWDLDVRAPLIQPGAAARVGEYLLAIDGRDIQPSADVYSYFDETAGKRVVLRVGSKPDGSDARNIAVVPIDDEFSLRHYAWIEGNRRKVDELTGGRVAYLYLPDTGANGFTSFNRYYFAQTGKEAAIIDERYNGGGLISDYFIDYFRRTLLAYWHMREGTDITNPVEGIFGPKVMIVNEIAGSGGDALPWMFRAAKIGPIIGKRTWGGLVGGYTSPNDFLDGGSAGTPNLAFYNPNGTWDVENHGITPDIDIENDPKPVREGHDPQLEKSVEVVLDLLKKNPPPSARKHPPYPNYYKNGTH